MVSSKVFSLGIPNTLRYSLARSVFHCSEPITYFGSIAILHLLTFYIYHESAILLLKLLLCNKSLAIHNARLRG
ncbi:Putative uncharacterized protein [Vibrio anguillarum]|nr:Putative uncharacterized protein [Vibrio anguillarum]